MQQALQNPHFKKIWEKVIMNRRPEAENLNLALGSEYLQYQKECIIITSQDGVIKEVLGRPITLFDILDLLNTNKEDRIYIANGSEIHKIPVGKFCDFASNLLEEQTPETWEKISNLTD